MVRAYSPQAGEFAVVNEVQFQYTGRMPHRLFAYAGLAAEKLDLPVYPVLVNLLAPPEGTAIAERYESELFGLRTRVDYRVINLWEVDVAIVFDRPLPPLLPFVPLLRGGGDEAHVRRALRALRADERLGELEPLLAFFASFVLETDLVQRIMRWEMVVLTKSPFYRQILADKGREDIVENLDAHFGRVPEDVAEKLKAISDLDRLRALLRLAVTAKSIEEFREELNEE